MTDFNGPHSSPSFARALIVPGLVFATLILGAWIYGDELREWFDPARESSALSTDPNSGQVEDALAYYTCPMHPSVRAPEMAQCPEHDGVWFQLGKNCPLCEAGPESCFKHGKGIISHVLFK